MSLIIYGSKRCLSQASLVLINLSGTRGCQCTGSRSSIHIGYSKMISPVISLTRYACQALFSSCEPFVIIEQTWKDCVTSQFHLLFRQPTRSSSGFSHRGSPFPFICIARTPAPCCIKHDVISRLLTCRRPFTSVLLFLWVCDLCSICK